METWCCIRKLLDMKREIAIKEQLSREELIDLDEINAILDRHTKTCEMLGKNPWGFEHV